MARPRPVPPNDSGDAGVGLLEGVEHLGLLRLGDADAGVAHGEGQRRRAGASAPSASAASDTSMAISPDGVNFIALPTMFTRIWRMRSASATSCSGTSGATR